MKDLSREEFERQKLVAINKAYAFQDWEKKGLVRMDYSNNRCVINYLIWHLWSEKGLVKFCDALSFYNSIKRAYDGLPVDVADLLTIWVDYGKEPNDYHKNGLVKMVSFSKSLGFKEV